MPIGKDALAKLTAAAKQRATRLIQQLIEQTRTASAATGSISDWLRHTFAIPKPSRSLLNFDALTPDAFVTAVQIALPRRRKLTAGDIANLKREHGVTIEPVRAAHRTIFALEQQLSDLINSAYGLTPEEVALMWDTAPSRMPFTPLGLATEGADMDADDDE